MNISVSRSLNDPWHEDVSTSRDYANVLIGYMNSLYLLSFLVTGNMQAAEGCFGKALDEYVEARSGFVEWAQQHGRRAVLRHAVQTVTPVPRAAYSWSFDGTERSLVSAAHQPFAAITSLNPFERFVFVMSVIEGMCEEECAALLNCRVQDVAIGRELAHAIIAVEDLSCELSSERDLFYMPTLLISQRCGIC